MLPHKSQEPKAREMNLMGPGIKELGPFLFLYEIKKPAFKIL